MHELLYLVQRCLATLVVEFGRLLLEENPDPTEEEIRWAISGNICRCTGYQNIVKAVQWAAKSMRESE